MKQFKIFLLLMFFCLSPASALQRHINGFSLFVNHPGYLVKKDFTKKRFIVAYKTPLKINGVLQNSAIIFGNGLIINGKVKKNIFAIKANVRVKQGGVVEGNIVSLGGRVVLEKGALAKKLNLSVLISILRLTGTFMVFFMYLSFVILGLFFNYYFIRNFVYIGDYIKNNFVSCFLVGALAIPLIFLLTLVLTGTIFGSLFLPAMFFIYIFFFFYSFYTISVMLGERIMKVFTFRNRPYFEQFLGVSFFFFLSIIPYLGLPLFVIFLLTGLGGVIKSKFGVRT